MDAWTDVLAHVARVYPVSSERDGRIELLVTQPRATGGTEQTTVDIRWVDVADARWLVVTCEIGGFQTLSTQELLANNMRTAIGAFCTRDGKLAVRQSLPLGQLRPHDLDDTVQALAHLAIAARVRLRELSPA